MSEHTSETTEEVKDLQEAAESQSQPAVNNPKEILQSIKAIPSRISEDIDSDRGSTIVMTIQHGIASSIGSIFSSCRILILQQLLLPEKTKDRITMTTYIVAGVVFVLEIIMLIFKCNIATISLSIESLLAAAIADNLLHRGVTTTKKRKSHSDEYL